VEGVGEIQEDMFLARIGGVMVVDRCSVERNTSRAFCRLCGIAQVLKTVYILLLSGKDP
jgi:hypothetical protein